MIKFTIFMSIALAALSASAQIRISKQGASLMVPNGAVPLDELENRDKVISKFKIEGDISN